MKFRATVFIFRIIKCMHADFTSPTEQGPKQALGTITGMALGGKIANDLTEDSSK